MNPQPILNRVVVKRTDEAKSTGRRMVTPEIEARPMKRINFELTVEELELLASLASDQLFRRQFIDPKMPGYKGSPEEVSRGKALLGRMRLILDDGRRQPNGGPPRPPSKERESL